MDGKRDNYIAVKYENVVKTSEPSQVFRKVRSEKKLDH